MFANLASLNYLAIIVSAIASMMFGFIWYSFIVAKPWMKLMGYNKLTKSEMQAMQKESGSAYMLSTFLSLLQAFILAWAILPNLTNVPLSTAMILIALIWLAFSLAYALNTAAFMKQSYKLAFINTGNQLFSILIMTAILKSWL